MVRFEDGEHFGGLSGNMSLGLQLSTQILKLALLSETGKNIVRSVKMGVWKKLFLIK